MLIRIEHKFLFAKGGPSTTVGKIGAGSSVGDTVLRVRISAAPDADEDLSYAEGSG